MQPTAISNEIISIFIANKLELRFPELFIVGQLVVRSVTLTKFECVCRTIDRKLDSFVYLGISMGQRQYEAVFVLRLRGYLFQRGDRKIQLGV